MQLLALFTLVFIAFADLTSDRLANAKLWIDRSHSASDMLAGYGTSVTTDGICHYVETTGDFCGRNVAMEYDSVVIAIELLGGIAPVKVWTLWDPSTTKWLTTDVLQADFEINVTTAYDFVNNIYLVNNQSFRFRELITFESGSPLIKIGYTIHDTAANKAFALADQTIPSYITCGGIIFPACNVSNGVGGSFLTDTNFTTIEECIAFLDDLNTHATPCPYQQRSNTQSCRNLHGTSSFLLPNIHCAHVRPNSSVCVDTCLPACSTCHANATCIATHPYIPTNFTTIYQCKCKPGYVGNGTYCEPKPCQYGNCPALYGSYECSSGLCKCTESFEHTPVGFGTDNLCGCPNGGQIVYNNSLPVCVPIGKCVKDQWECNLQSYNQVKCKTFGVNTFSNFKDCICNYGFQGGWEYPCVCPSGRRVVWSDTLSSELCLSTTECTANWHCTYPQTCTIPSGHQIGTCS